MTVSSHHRLRFVCVSDTHNHHDTLTERVNAANADVLIHAGDFTARGTLAEVQHFNAWLGSLQVKHKVVIAGNHDLTLDAPFYQYA